MLKEVLKESDKSPEKKVSIACGIAVYDSRNGGSVDDALKQADEAMYADKRRIKQENP